MDKTKTRIIVSLVSLIVFMTVFFGVLATEEKKRLTKLDQEAIERQEMIDSISATIEARKEYYARIAEQRAKLEQQMSEDKKRYEELLNNQPGIIASQKRQKTQVVEKVVPKTETVTVSGSSGSSSTQSAPKRTTKTS